MKATLHFDLLEESFEHQCAINGIVFRRAIAEFQEYMRQQYKYDENLTEEQKQIVQHLREYLQNILMENGVHQLVVNPY